MIGTARYLVILSLFIYLCRYNIDWSNSVYSTLAVSGFLPLLIQSAALSAADFPNVCANLIKNATLIDAVFTPDKRESNESIASMYYLAGSTGLECDSTTYPTCVSGYCKGEPASTSDCKLANGVDDYPLRVTGTDVDPTSFATLAISLSVGAQVIVFLCVASTADYGNMRKKVLLGASLVGAAFTILCAGKVFSLHLHMLSHMHTCSYQLICRHHTIYMVGWYASHDHQ
jgi:MFS-type transporter involved in bile tolerance (Atg22 family)